MTQSITAAVGQGGTNLALDVAIIQALLSMSGIPEEAGGAPLLEIDGKLGAETGAAIRQFQAIQLAMADGLVQPSDYTMKRLNALANHFQDPTIPGTPLGLKHIALLKTGTDLGDVLGPAETLPDAEGMVQRWTGGNIYHHPLTGAFATYGLILAAYVDQGETQSSLGYPISDERAWTDGNGRVSYFQLGSVYWTATMGATVVPAPGL